MNDGTVLQKRGEMQSAIFAKEASRTVLREISGLLSRTSILSYKPRTVANSNQNCVRSFRIAQVSANCFAYAKHQMRVLKS